MHDTDYSWMPDLSSSLKNRRRIFPRKKPNENEYYGSAKLFHPGKKKSKKVCACHHKKCLAVSQQSIHEANELNKLTRNFLSHKFSAAGVSYIIRSPSRLRKFLWFTAIVVTTAFMGYMTYNVIKEYLQFPKMLIREESITPKLQFPAVTLCSLNPIVNVTSDESSVYRLMELKKLIESAQVAQTDSKLRDDCYIYPLCQWSWFNETCQCVQNPCSTEFCLVENSTHCACSINVCRDFTATSSCVADTRSDRCICSNAVKYTNPTELETYRRGKEYDVDWKKISPSVRDVMELIRHSTTYDLVDIEEALMPNVNDLLEYGIKFDNLVISCSFEGSACYRENFTVLYHPTYGRCYMFNYLGMTESTEKPVFANNYGSSSGLRLILHVMRQDKIDILNAEIGARIIVHDPYNLPFVQEFGVNVRPHDMSAIEVKQSIVKRLQQPYGNCVVDGSHLKFTLPSGQPYSILGCQKACRHFYLMQACNCTKRSYITGSVSYTKTIDVNYCQLENATRHDCMSKTISRIEQGIILCDCRPPCTETKFTSTVSSSALNENYYKAVKNIRTFSSGTGTDWKTINATDVSNLMVGVKVYYSTFQVDSDNEQASYSWETLIANIGGNLGFFMGLTLVTFIEVLEFLWDLLVTSVRRYRQ